ncbi:SGNH/GDSL hydrolase family protein [Virgibacillus siamensis]|uniref:SGNH/GDSL hydrolase family protein n=1 Tax=Virgibacillus siamensis TaxID=480071 RepID=UPI00098540F7|nr:SGNH/GDSL hydrolase family protein [Virgibacillus siamensis]
MKKRYIFTILVILLIGFGFLIVMNLPDQDLNNKVDHPLQNQEKLEKKSDQKKTPDKKEEKKNQSGEKDENPVTRSVKIILSEALERTVDLFTNKESHIVAIGDSLTQGVGDNVVDGGYVGILEGIMNEEDSEQVTFDNYGVRGNTTSQMYSRMNNPGVKQSLKDADVILITIGANDIMEVVKHNITDLTLKDFQQERIAYKERLKNIFDTMRKYNPDAEIYLIGFYNPFEKFFPKLEELGVIVENWNSTSKNITQQYDDITFIPTVDLFADKNADFFYKDHFHPSHQGYQLIAKRVLEYITDK